jgi:hypothetical protein
VHTAIQQPNSERAALVTLHMLQTHVAEGASTTSVRAVLCTGGMAAMFIKHCTAQGWVVG